MNNFHVLIPARYQSTRLPGKPLLQIAGKPMLQHVHEKALASGARSVVIATDDERIAAAARKFSATVCMTSPGHDSGSERLAEAVELLGLEENEIIVNLQGDEPLMPPELLRQVAQGLARHADIDMATLCTRILDAGELFDPNAVKVVMDARGRALYFSRAPIPWDRDAFAVSREQLPEHVPHYRHLGLYAYRVAYLKQYAALSPCALEQRESLEQLRVLWHGAAIHVAEAAVVPPAGVDTEKDLARVRAVFAGLCRQG